MAEMLEEDERFKKIRSDKDLKRSYLSTISAKFNPDLLIGSALVDDDRKGVNVLKMQISGKTKIQPQFMRGNEYFS